MIFGADECFKKIPGLARQTVKLADLFS